MKRIWIWILIFIVVCLFSYIWNQVPISVDRNFEKMNFEGYDNLMVVAHPDDETFWGGAHLLEDKYVVVCITCGTRKDRVKEFKKAMNYSEDKYIMLAYPDLKFGKKANWKKEAASIQQDLNRILKLKHWKKVVTHNPDGEYGHIHHKMTNQFITYLYHNNYQGEHDLYYFGRYYTVKNIRKVKDSLTEIDKEYVNPKIKDMVSFYTSQSYATGLFKHMFKYEEWVNAADWNTQLVISRQSF